MTDADFATRDLDYTAGAGETAADYPTLSAKFEQATEVVRTALEEYRDPAVLWTGGKDSTLALYVVREVAAEHDLAVPPVVFVDHFAHRPAVTSFVQQWTGEWGLDLVVARNESVADLDVAVGDEVPVSTLDERTRRELDRLGVDDDTVEFSPDSFAGTHLLQTVALNDIFGREGYDALVAGIRWDDHEARADETFFSPRRDAARYPPHDRVHPILPFDERAVWDATWGFVVPDTVPDFPAGYVPQGPDDLPGDLSPADVPVSSRYFEGVRSLGTATDPGERGDDPAWLQDGRPTAGRERDDGAGSMQRLRELGYV
jgi:phosphoadenosine phosphosulfate reductase